MPGTIGAILEGGQTYGIRLDWKSYFYRFVEAHGEPVVYGEGRLLFRDGWQYAIGNYQGPEYAPPIDVKELRGLKRRYWKMLRSKLQKEYENLGSRIAMLQDWGRSRDMPLQQSVVYASRNDDGVIASKRTEGEDLDLAPLHTKMIDLRHLLEECDENLVTDEGDS